MCLSQFLLYLRHVHMCDNLSKLKLCIVRSCDFCKVKQINAFYTIKIIDNGSVSLCDVFKFRRGGVRGCAGWRA
jgi:hypothetical protein